MTDGTPDPARQEVPPGVTVVDPGWARTSADDDRPFDIERLARHLGLLVSDLPRILGVSGRVVGKWADRGLTHHQARIGAHLAGVEPFDVWRGYDEDLVAFLARHESRTCVRCLHA